MLNRQQIKDYRLNRGLTTRDVAWYCGLCQPYITMIENGKKRYSKQTHDRIVRGINSAYQAKKDGTYMKPPNENFTQDTWDVIVKLNHKRHQKLIEHYHRFIERKDGNE